MHFCVVIHFWLRVSCLCFAKYYTDYACEPYECIYLKNLERVWQASEFKRTQNIVQSACSTPARNYFAASYQLHVRTVGLVDWEMSKIQKLLGQWLGPLQDRKYSLSLICKRISQLEFVSLGLENCTITWQGRRLSWIKSFVFRLKSWCFKSNWSLTSDHRYFIEKFILVPFFHLKYLWYIFFVWCSTFQKRARC